MALPRTILFPVDFSDHCRSVWPAVSMMARHLNAPVTMLHAVEAMAAELDIAVLGQAELLHAHLRQKLDNFLVPETQALTVQRDLLDGAAAAAIVSRAANLDGPLIMIPTRGHTRFRQLLLGSVTAAVLHDAVCPVWTNAHAQKDGAFPESYRSIVCAVDLGPQTPHVLCAAQEFSAHLKASLHVVHSVPGIDPRFHSQPASHAHRILMEEAREYYSALGAGVPVEIVEDVGLVSGILRTAIDHRADLLVIGRGVIQGTLGRLRTNAHELIRRSPCPVLSV